MRKIRARKANHNVLLARQALLKCNRVKNPGFQKDDQIIIEANRKNKPSLSGAVAVILE
jgi:hypothetical protein